MPSPLEPEARIGGYELVRRIGVGGMAEVWVARRVSERKANKYVAIKVVADPHVNDPRFQRMFKAEVELSALLNHVNIVQVFDEGEDRGRAFLVMEWVDGVNLVKVGAALTFVDDESWRLSVISYVVAQLLYALAYAHSITLHDGNPLGIVHRDVTPHNVLVSAQGEVKLTDFGVAHHLLEETSGVHVKGKLRYMAPEQVAGQTRDPRVDLYAVGAIFHELLDGRRFRHDAEDQQRMYLDALSGKIPAMSRAVPSELDELRLGLLEPEPERRIRSADAALDRLRRYPGYGDARRELAQLCGGITGVVRPRIGPGTSAASTAARVVAAPEPQQGSSPADTEPGNAVEPSKTQRMTGHGAARDEALEIDPTQTWRPGAIVLEAPAPVSQRVPPSAHTTERVDPPLGAVEAAPSRRRPIVPWVLLGVVATVVSGSVAWVSLDRPWPLAARLAVAGDRRDPRPRRARVVAIGDARLAGGHGGAFGRTRTCEPIAREREHLGE